MTSPLLKSLLQDLAAEHDSLLGLLESMGDGDWDRPTPAEGWDCRDQVSHLAFFDDMATLAIRDPARFGEERREAAPDTERYMQRHLEMGRSMAPAELLMWWQKASQGLLAVLEDRGDRLPRRLPWYGHSMAPASFVTARLMETWAHGHDVADALAVARPPTPRLRHIADLGVRTRRFSYELRGLTMPEGDVEVRLWLPDGEELSWSPGSEAHIYGPVEDFALVVTQRRHVDDTRLEMSGPEAREWMLIAQAFAGAPGAGRPRSTGVQAISEEDR